MKAKEFIEGEVIQFPTATKSVKSDQDKYNAAVANQTGNAVNPYFGNITDEEPIDKDDVHEITKLVDDTKDTYPDVNDDESLHYALSDIMGIKNWTEFNEREVEKIYNGLFIALAGPAHYNISISQ